MSRINTNVSSLVAQRVLGQNNFGLNNSLERLSTGLRINRGKDDPAGLIASENLRSEIKAVSAAINNAERAERVVNIAEGGLSEVSGLLVELQGLITNSANTAGLSDAEKNANQLQIDSILQTIDRVADQTSFQGSKLLNGNLDFRVSSQASGIDDLRVNGAKFDGDSLDVNVLVTQSAQRGGLFLSLGATSLNLGGTGGTDGTTSTFVVEITGSLGSREFSFASGTTLAQVKDTINTFSDVLGVSAVTSGTGIRLQSTEFGEDAFTTVKVIDDAQQAGGVYNLTSTNFASADTSSGVAYSATSAANGIRDEGQDIGATINGIVATTDGKTAKIDTDFLNLQVTLDTSTSQTLGAVGTGRTFAIAGGGATFQLGGKVDIQSKVTLGVSEVAIRKLGSNAAGGFLDDLSSGKSFNVVDGDLTAAQKVVSEAIEQVSTLRGRLGAFQRNTLGATRRSLGVNLENSSAAESVIRDTDFASETAALTRSQILVSAATNTLSLANSQPQTALQLLG
ncbi:MAG TPA: flagellin [Phycisphaerales bacterium]|nr:flagellin [Phycisphaerales bacterium]